MIDYVRGSEVSCVPQRYEDRDEDEADDEQHAEADEEDPIMGLVLEERSRIHAVRHF